MKSSTLTIVGLGVAGFDVLSSLNRELDSIFITVNIVDIDFNKINKVKDSMGNKFILSFHSTLSSVDDLGVVYLGLPPKEINVAIKCISHKKIDALVVEKPGPLTDIIDNEEFVIPASIEKEKVFVCHQRQYSDHFNWVSDKISSQSVGDPDTAIVSIGKWDFITAGTHWMAFTHLLFGTPLYGIGKVCMSTGRIMDKYGYFIEDEAYFTVIHESGVTVKWRLSPQYGKRSDLRILCANGVIDVKCPNNGLVKVTGELGTENYDSYGNPRYKILEAAALGQKPKVGCRADDLCLYIKLFENLKHEAEYVSCA